MLGFSGPNELARLMSACEDLCACEGCGGWAIAYVPVFGRGFAANFDFKKNGSGFPGFHPGLFSFPPSGRDKVYAGLGAASPRT